MQHFDSGRPIADCGSQRARGCRAAARRGITLLEVLISMFVMLVGVISVFSLIALGRFEMLEGSKADRAMSLARSAQHDLLARGYLRPVQIDYFNAATIGQFVPMWISAPDTTGAYHYLWGPGSPGFGGPSVTPPAAWPAGTIPTMPFDVGTVAYAIDPLGVSANLTAVSSGLAVQGVSYNFPAYYVDSATVVAISPTGTQMSMTRLTLRAGPSAGFTEMTVSHADAIFRSQDDLLLQPPSGDYPPTQLFSIDKSSVKPTRRQSTGDYSWLATIVPTQGDSKSCIVSVVVFYKRNFLLTTPTATAPPPERMVSLTPALGSTGLGGGDVTLSCPSTSGMSADYIKVKPNQWILLSQPATASNPAGFFRWYRVAATSAPINNGTNWVRPVTLAGPDWTTTAGGSPIMTYASIFDDAIGVYERNIELEETSAPWAPN